MAQDEDQKFEIDLEERARLYPSLKAMEPVEIKGASPGPWHLRRIETEIKKNDAGEMEMHVIATAGRQPRTPA